MDHERGSFPGGEEGARHVGGREEGREGKGRKGRESRRVGPRRVYTAQHSIALPYAMLTWGVRYPFPLLSYTLKRLISRLVRLSISCNFHHSALVVKCSKK